MDADMQAWYLDRARSLVEVLEQGEQERAEAILSEIEHRRCSDSFDELGRLSERLQALMARTGMDGRLVDLADRDIPDARERLNYVIATTETAANGTLGHVEVSLPICDRIIAFAEDWKNQAGDDIRDFVLELPVQIRSIRQALNEIMLAQSFQDITGQVLGQVIEVVSGIERVLATIMKGHQKQDRAGPSRMGVERDMGPAVPGCQGGSRVTGQDEIDDLLAGLGV